MRTPFHNSMHLIHSVPCTYCKVQILIKSELQNKLTIKQMDGWMDGWKSSLRIAYSNTMPSFFASISNPSINPFRCLAITLPYVRCKKFVEFMCMLFDWRFFRGTVMTKGWCVISSQAENRLLYAFMSRKVSDFKLEV